MSDHHRYKIRDYQFGFQVLQLREKAGLTQAQIAKSLNISERAIQHWEGGSSRPTPARANPGPENFIRGSGCKRKCYQ